MKTNQQIVITTTWANTASPPWSASADVDVEGLTTTLTANSYERRKAVSRLLDGIEALENLGKNE